MSVSGLKNSIIQRSDGQMEERLQVGLDKGRNQSTQLYNYPSLHRKMRSAAAYKASDETLDFYKHEWLKSAQDSLKESTSSRYSHIYDKYIKPVAGEMKCAELSQVHIEKIIENCTGYSEKTTALVFSVFKLIIDYAKNCGCAVQLDLHGFTAVGCVEPNLRFLDKTELARLNSAVLLAQDFTGMCIFLCMNTGIRLGELCALKRGDIDFSGRTLSVTKVMQRIQKKDGEAKTAVTVSELSGSNAKRNVPIPQFVIKAIQPQLETLSPEAWLTTGTSDAFTEPRTMENRLKRLCDDIGLSNINFLALRHTFAMRCAEIGVDSYTLSLILGISDVTQVVKMYYKAEMKLADALERLECC